MRWIAAGALFPQTPAASADPAPRAKGDPAMVVTTGIYGWRRGYVGFRSVDDMSGAPLQNSTLVSTSSSDGLHWTAGRSLNMEGLKYAVQITQVVEGPAGLLAVGRYPGAACGGPPGIEALWTSPDGLIWTRVALSADFVSAGVFAINAGSTGYVAAGTLKDGLTQAVWLSPDGVTWHQVGLPKATFGTVVVNGATNFGAGYVIAGAVRGDEGCGGYNTLTPSLWWSADGTSWTRSKLAGAAPSTDAWIALTRISDHSLVAIATEWNAATQVTSEQVWATADGRTWKAVESPSSLLGTGILSDGQRGLAVVIPLETAGSPAIATVGDDLTVTPLVNAGDIPSISNSSGWYSTAFGPTGVVILSSDGSTLWLGVPTNS
jgi:hypothetical protein